jgi:hypothetical protein
MNTHPWANDATTPPVIFSPPLFAAVPPLPHRAVASAAPNDIRGPSDVANEPTVKTARKRTWRQCNGNVNDGKQQRPAIDARVWRDLVQLAVEALAIGVVFSILLALAVFVVARGTRGDEFAASQISPAEFHSTTSVG